MDQDISHISLVIDSFEFEPNILTEQLELTPTKVAKKGEKVKIANLMREAKYSWWEYELPVKEYSGDIELGLRLLLTKLAPAEKWLLNLSTPVQKTVQVGLTRYDHHLGISIDVKLIREFCKLDLSLDIDAYMLGEVDVDK